MIPAGAEYAEDWAAGESHRAVYWPETAVSGDVRVSITGMQSRSGETWRCVTMWANCPELSAAESRNLARTLWDKADELEAAHT